MTQKYGSLQMVCCCSEPVGCLYTSGMKYLCVPTYCLCVGLCVRVHACVCVGFALARASCRVSRGSFCLLVLIHLVLWKYSFKVCGNYCGPGWCSGEYIDEKSCFETMSPQGQCADQCCRVHDACCGQYDRSACNDAIANCLYDCGGDMSCTYGLPFYFIFFLPRRTSSFDFLQE